MSGRSGYRQLENQYWTYAACKKVASKYDSLVGWITHDYPSYLSANKNNWQRKIGNELGWVFANNGSRTHKTYQEVLAMASQHTYMEEWVRASREDHNAHRYANRKRWLDRIRKDLAWEIRKSSPYTFEFCLEDAKRFSSFASWRKEDKTYRKSIRAKWKQKIVEELTSTGQWK